MRNIAVVSASALTILLLGGCGQQASQSPQPKPEAKRLDDGGDTPITISDSSSAPVPLSGGPKTATTTKPYLAMTTSGNPAPLFSSWTNNAGSHPNISEVDPNYMHFDGVKVGLTTYCANSPAKCHVKIWYEDQNNPTIFFDYDGTANPPAGSHMFALKSTKNGFKQYTNWADPVKGNDIINPTSSTISKVTIDDGNGEKSVPCSTPCSIAIEVH